jgi:hypothetical protein
MLQTSYRLKSPLKLLLVTWTSYRRVEPPIHAKELDWFPTPSRFWGNNKLEDDPVCSALSLRG